MQAIPAVAGDIAPQVAGPNNIDRAARRDVPEIPALIGEPAVDEAVVVMVPIDMPMIGASADVAAVARTRAVPMMAAKSLMEVIARSPFFAANRS
jgi:hypothetical protein